jgi:hypothetical protein
MLPPDDPRHGLNGYSNLGCRCPICREAQRVSHRDYMRRNPAQQAKHRARRKRQTEREKARRDVHR